MIASYIIASYHDYLILPAMREEEAARYVPASGERDGVSGQQEIGA